MSVLNVVLVTALVASLQPRSFADRCPSSWISWEQHCYRFELNNPATWNDAENLCSGLGLKGRPSHLVSIHSHEEQNFLYEVFSLAVRQKSQSKWGPSFYIGIFVGKTATDLSWSDGSCVDYQDWHRGVEPNNFPNSGGQISDGEGLAGRWIDSINPNKVSRYYACKMTEL